jgi:hypothetical protein
MSGACVTVDGGVMRGIDLRINEPRVRFSELGSI